MSTRDYFVDQEQCEKYAACLGLVVNDPYIANEEKTCAMVSTNSEEEDPAEINPADILYADFVETNGSIATSLDGTKDMIVLQEYAPGRFGYMSNYRFHLPKNNIIRLNGKEIFPLIPNAPINEELQYNFDIYSLKQTAKNRAPDSFTPYFETLSFGLLDSTSNASNSSNLNTALAAGTGIGLGSLFVVGPLTASGIGIAVAAVIMLFAGNKKYGMIRTHWDIKKRLPDDVPYSLNPYGYEFREYDPDTRTLTYERTKFQMAMQKEGDFEKTLSDYLGMKKSSLYFSGYTHEQIDTTLVKSCEKNTCVGYPGKIKWYKFSGLKSNSATNQGTNDIGKPVNTIYMGATNTVVVFVPYKGDYEMVALDKNKNILGRRIIRENDFLDSDAYKYPFAKVMFSLSPEFGLATGVENGTVDKACLYDDFVEWGGGVSGVYYESGTPNGHHCSKSNDNYVQDFSAHYIQFKAVDADKYFEVKLKKPMPFANRFYFVNLGKLEKRNYECYQLPEEPCRP